MGLTARVARAIESRVAKQYTRFFRSTFVRPYFDNREGVDSHLRAVLRDQRLSLIEVFKKREDGRGVFLVRDSGGVKRVLKTWYTPLGMDHGIACMHRANWVARSGGQMVPKVLRTHASYTLEEFVDGPLLASASAVDDDQMRTFLEDLKSWSKAGREAQTTSGDEYLAAFEVTERCRAEIKRAFRHALGHSGRRMPLTIHRFRRKRHELGGAMHELASMTHRVRIPRYMMFGDMHPENIVVHQESGRLMVLDYEEMREGHFGFDLASLSSKVYRQGFPSSIYDPLEAHLKCDEYLEGNDVSLFFQQLNVILRKIYGVIFDGRPGSASARE